MHLNSLNTFSLIFYLFFSQIKSSWSLWEKCPLKALFSQEYELCMTQASTNYEELIENHGKINQTLSPNYTHCLHCKHQDCFEDSLKIFCPDHLNFMLDVKENEIHNCSLNRTEYENSIEKCFDCYSDESKSQDNFITRKWKILVLFIAIFITFVIFSAILVRKFVDRYQKKRHSQSQPPIHIVSIERLI